MKMSKAILVIDKPKFCSECLFCKTTKTNDIWEFEENRCMFTNYIVEHSSPDKQSSCPLREMSKSIDGNIPDIVDFYSYVRGWNDCIDEILGE